MNPGIELDALVAEKVMGMVPCSDPMGKCDASKMNPCQCWGHGGGGSELFGYSTYISDAWEVVLEMQKRNLCWSIDLIVGLDSVKRVRCIFRSWLGNNEKYGFGEERTAPHAICLAALKAVGVDTK